MNQSPANKLAASFPSLFFFFFFFQFDLFMVYCLLEFCFLFVKLVMVVAVQSMQLWKMRRLRWPDPAVTSPSIFFPFFPPSRLLFPFFFFFFFFFKSFIRGFYVCI